MSEMPRLHQPGHPHADADGYVTLPNVKLPHEMVDMMTAARAYEANLKSIQIFRNMTEQSLSLLKGS
jgi:flagellar basal-body rod protein FlgC